MSSMDFHVENQQGHAGVVDDDHVLSQLKQMGYPVAGISADGMHVTFNDPQQGQYQVKTQDALKEMGWNVKSMLPSSPDYDNIQSSWRAGIESLPQDDDMRKAYLEAKLRRQGIQDPSIVGTGSDWHVFNPQTSQWIALTNKPGIDTSDLAEVAAAAPHFLGSALGGTAGGALGTGLGGPVGSVAGAAVGAGLGGAGGDALERYAMSRFDPEYRQIASQHFGDVAKDVAKTGGMDALTFGGLKALGLASPALRTMIAKGPVSTGLKTLGAATEGAGALAGGGAKALAGSPGASEFAANFVPGLGDAMNVGELAQLPGSAVRAIPRTLNWLGSNEVVAPLFGDEGAAGLRSAAEAIAKPRAGMGPSTAQTFARALGGAEESSTVQEAGNALGNLFEKGAGWAGYPEGGEAAGRFGEALGRSAGHLENVGRGVTRTGVGAFRMGMRGVQGVGRGAQMIGAGARNLGTMAQPLEVPAAARYGVGKAEEALRRLRPDDVDDMLKDKTVLAQGY